MSDQVHPLGGRNDRSQPSRLGRAGSAAARRAVDSGVDRTLVPARVAALAVSAAMVLVTSGCGGEDHGADTPVNDLPALTLVEELRLGDTDDPDVGFSRPTSVAPRPDGTFAVVEAQGIEIRVYDAGGTPLHRFGTRGEGPGEFSAIPSIGWVADTLWAMDGGHQRLTTFLADGTVLGANRIETLEVPLPSGRGTIFPTVPREDGTLTGHLVRVTYRPDDPDTGLGPDAEIPVPLVRYGLQGQVLDTLGFLNKPNPAIWSREAHELPDPDYIQLDERRVRIPTPRAPLPQFQGVSDGYVEFRAPAPRGGGVHELTIHRVRPDGDTAWSRELSWRPIPYTAEDLDSIATRAARSGGAFGTVAGGSREPPEGWEDLRDRIRTRMDFPSHQGFAMGSWLANDGTLWIRMQAPEAANEVEWLLVDVDGEPLGRVVLGAEDRPLWNHGDEFWVSEPDDIGVPWLVRYRIEAD